MFTISLDWKRPADGVDIVPAMEVHPNLLIDGNVIKGKSDRTIKFAIKIEDLAEPVSIRLINAQDEAALGAFVSRFGVPDERMYNLDGSVLVAELEALRDDLEQGLSLTNDQDDTARALWAADVLADATFHPAFEFSENEKRQKLVFRPSGLSDLLKLETAFAFEAGARLQSCEHCSKRFLTGPKTGRRATATYCSDRCRVAAMRARNAQSNDF